MRLRGSLMILNQSKYFVATLDLLKPIGVTLASFGLIYLLFFSRFFQVTSVTCVQDVGEECQNDFVKAEINTLFSNNLFLLNEVAVIERLYSGDPTIRQVNISKSLPGSINVDIQSVIPTLALSTPQSDRILVLDSEFRIIKAVATDPNVPVLIYDQDLSLRLGQKIEDKLVIDLLNATLALTQAFPVSRQVRVQGKTLSLNLERELVALFTINTTLAPQIAALQSLRNNATIPEETAEIDLRYSQPVLRDKSSL